MKLNLGCGDRYVDGWHNVDFAGSPHRKDEEIDLRRNDLPWTGVELAYAGHVLEHLFVNEAITLLAALRKCMAPKGELMVVGPDVILAEGLAITNSLGFGHTLDSIKHGGFRWHGDEHRWQCTQWDVMAMLKAAGWSQIQNVGIGNVPDVWPIADRGPQWQCAVSATPRQMR